jgi:hypothetical protein
MKKCVPFLLLFLLASCFDVGPFGKGQIKCLAGETGDCPDGLACMGGYCGGGAGGTTRTLSFRVAQTLQTGAFPDRLTAGDFNGDGKLDLAVAYSQGMGLQPWLGNGNGMFTAGPMVSMPNAKTLQIAAGDLNGDKRDDLAVSDFQNSSVRVLLNAGNGSFVPSQVLPAGTGTYWGSIADVDGDGRPDLVVGAATSSSIMTFRGNGNGTFQSAKAMYQAGTNPSGMALGDMNQDGIMDVVTCNFTSADVSVLPGNGDGSFRLASSVSTGLQQNGVAVGDFNHDGKYDLAVSLGVEGVVGVLLGIGGGSFAPLAKFAAGQHPYGVAVADFDGDGLQDVAAVDSGSSQPGGSIGDIAVLLGTGDGNFRVAQKFAVGKQPVFLAVGDWDNDGLPDVATGNVLDNTVSVLLNVSQ